MTIPVVVVGLGPIGARICNRLLSRSDQVHVIAAVDTDPAKTGRPLAEVLGASTATDLRVVTAVPAAPHGGGVAVQSTSSQVDLSAAQAIELLRSGWNVLTTCEELAWVADPVAGVTGELNVAARDAGLTVLASGINPGFMMDTLPLTLTAFCASVERITVNRVVNTDDRREPLQRKAGVGMHPDEFRRLAAEGHIGHVGLRQSVNLIASRLGWRLTAIDLTLEPVIATAALSTGLGSVAAGMVSGQHQTAVSRVGSREVIRFDLVMAAGERSLDEVVIDGEPSVHQRIEGGVNGDIGTEAVIANLVRPVYEARPGLLTMGDLVAVVCGAPSGV